jgi:hypothetical protein
MDDLPAVLLMPSPSPVPMSFTDRLFLRPQQQLGARNPNTFITQLVNGVFQRVALKPEDVRYQFGGAVGGPIVKDKVFFFFSYDEQKRNFPGVAVFSTANYLDTVSRTTLLARA